MAVILPLAITPLVATPALRDYPSMYYLLIVAGAAIVGRLVAGLVAAFVSAAIFGAEFLSPSERIWLDGTSIEVFIAFCVIAVVLAQLVSSVDAAHSRARDQAEKIALTRRVSDALGSSIDYDETLRAVGDVLIPDLADWFSVHLLDDVSGRIENAYVAHLDPERVALARDLWRRYPAPTLDDPQGVGCVIRTGEPEITREVSDEMIVGTLEATFPELIPVLRELRLRSVLVVPMIAADRTLGAIQLVSAESGRIYDDEDLALAQEIGRRAAIAIENAMLYRQRQDEVRALQRRLLPRSLPTIPGIDIAARYLPADQSVLVGGDFYDLFRVGDEHWKAVIGDVSGKGVEAAALMGFVRYTTRAVSDDETRPSEALHRLNRAFREEIGDETTFCTAALARIHPNDDGARLTIAVAGHPLPYTIRSDGTVETSGSTGPLLGFLDDIELSDTVVDLRPGDSVLFLTDGVLEASRDPLWSDQVVPEVLSTTAGMHPDTVVEIVDGTVGSVDDRRSDDIALLVVHIPTDAPKAHAGAARAVVLDADMCIVDANGAFLADLEQRRDEVTGRPFSHLLVDDDRTTVPADAAPSGRLTLRSGDGRAMTYDARSTRLRGDERTVQLVRLTAVGDRAPMA